MALCRDFVAGEPFALLLPDNLFPGEDHDLGPLAAAAVAAGRDAVGILEVGTAESGLYGNSGRIDHRQRDDGTLELLGLADKQPGRLSVAPGESFLRACGRYVFQADVFDWIDRVRPRVRGELSEVPVVQEILRQRGGLGVRLRPPLFDIGHPAGVLAASAFLHRRLHPPFGAPAR
jgi:UTP-glucose-1-phosphate uridylyltransferase